MQEGILSAYASAARMNPCGKIMIGKNVLGNDSSTFLHYWESFETVQLTSFLHSPLLTSS